MFQKAAGGVIVSALALTSLAGPVGAAGAEELRARYDLYTRGIRAFVMDYKLDATPSDYTVSAAVKPKGLASLFIDLKMKMTSQGAVSGNEIRPRNFTMDVKEKGKRGKYQVRFDGSRPASSQRDPELSPDKAAKIASASKKGVHDTLAAMLELSFTDTDNPCDRTYRVYNGREVFQLALSRVKTDTLGDKDGGVYRGPALVCQMVYSTLAGLSPKTEAKYRKKPPTFHVWLAPVQSKKLKRKIHVLVAVTGKIKGKDFVAYINRATLSGKPLNDRSLAKR